VKGEPALLSLTSIRKGNKMTEDMNVEKAADILVKMLEVIVVNLVDHEDCISISTGLSGETVLFEVDVHKDDVGKLIGREGKMAGAIRHILAATSRKLNVRTLLAIPDKKGT